MMRVALLGALLLGACTSDSPTSAGLAGAWTWEGADCAVRKYEFTNDAIRAVLPGRNAPMYKILETYVGDGNPREVVLDLQFLPQRGMSAVDLQFLKDTGGVHSVALTVDGDTIRPRTLSMNGNSIEVGPGHPTFKEFSLHRCPAGAVS